MLETLDSLDVEIKGYPQQLDFIQCKDFRSFFIAGVGSGKSHAGALKALDFCLRNPGAKGMVTAPTYKVLEDATIPIYEKVFPPTLVLNKKMRPYPEWKLWNGCMLSFWSTQKPETIAGVEFAFAHMDECSISPYLSYMNIRQRLRQTRNGGSFPYQLWGTTTPRQLNWLYQECMDERDPATLFQAVTQDNKYIDAESYVSRLGLSEGSKEYEQVVLGKFLLLAGDCLFDENILQQRLGMCVAPINVRANGMIQVWREPVVGARYIAGADCADEGGEGLNDLIIIDAVTGLEMAEINADIRADKFAQMVFDLCEEYRFPLLAPERNSTAGGVVTQKLIDLGYPNLYRDAKGKVGWYTTTTAYPPKVDRYTMLLEYKEAFETRQTDTLSSDAIGEMSTFVRDEKGKFKHRSGCKDDRIFARAICWQMRKRKETTGGFFSVKRRATTYN